MCLFTIIYSYLMQEQPSKGDDILLRSTIAVPCKPHANKDWPQKSLTI